MKTVSLVGASSRDIHTLNCNQTCKHFKPDHFEWDMTGGSAEVGVFLDPTIKEARNRNDFDYKIAMLWEPKEYRPQHYTDAVQCENDFDMILTHDSTYVGIGKKWQFYYAGGQFVATPQYLPEKTDFLSIITGWKTELPGHKLRFEAAKLLNTASGAADVFTYPFEPKSKALMPYMFSIVIENVQQNWWFTEKLIDPMITGTVPIYWGSKGLNKFFDINGIIYFDTLEELRSILSNLSVQDYYDRMESIKTNFERAKRYAITENVLSELYPQYFK